MVDSFHQLTKETSTFDFLSKFVMQNVFVDCFAKETPICFWQFENSLHFEDISPGTERSEMT